MPDFHERVALLMGSSQVFTWAWDHSKCLYLWSMFTGNKRTLWTDRLPWLGQHQLTVEAINTLTPSGVEVFHGRNVIHSMAKIITCAFHLSVFFPHTCCHQPCSYVLGGDFTFTVAQGPQCHLDFHMQGYLEGFQLPRAHAAG